ncbi:MAG: site-specific integrase [Hyphomicrobiales bacterium]
MNDMPKQQYLSKDNKGWKLRRRVPQALKELAGKENWIERIAGVDYRTACEKAKVFGVTTDTEIKRLEGQLKSSPAVAEASTADEPGFKFGLTDHELDQIAIAYFHDLEQQIQKGDGYRKGITDENRHEILVELAENFEEADALATADQAKSRHYPDQDIRTAFHLVALKQLIKYHFLDQQDFQHTYKRSSRGKIRQHTGLKVTADLRSNPSFQQLADRLAEANAEIARRRLEAVSENRHPTLQNPVFEKALETNAEITPQRSVRVAELVKEYLQHKEPGITKSRFDQLKTATRALEEEVGKSIPLSEITRTQCQSIADLFVVIPPYAKRHYKRMSLRKASETFAKKNGEPAQRVKEAGKNLAVLNEIFEFAVDQEWLASNPTQRVKINKPARPKSYFEHEEGYEPFTADELKIIFNRPLYTGCQDDRHGINKPGPNLPRRSRFWLPLISTFSGLRMQEILQLEKHDIKQTDGVYYFDVNDKVHGNDYAAEEEYVKRLKAKNSLRKVPIHPELIKIGFLSYVEQSERQWLFPDMPLRGASKMSDQFSKRFRVFMKPTGLSVPRRKVFHSFRNSFNDALRAADVRMEHREQILGWVDHKKMDSRYGHGHLIKRLHEEVARVEYEGLDLSHLYER